MISWIASTENERGSVLLISLVVIFAMTVLGLALFELGVIENRLVHASEADARAFQIGQAGVERALWKLQDTFNNNGHSWAAPTSTTLCTGGGHAGCSDSQFYPAAAGYLTNLSFDSGNYALEFKQVTAETLSVPCKTDRNVTSDVDNTKKICDDLIFIRATGSLTNTPPGYSPLRTFQLLAQAALNPATCFICGGLTGASGTGEPINGNVKIAGSIFIGGKQTTISLSLSGNAGQTNSYVDLDALSLARIPRLPLVCPFGSTCSGSSGLVESLGATLKVARPTDIAAVVLGSGAVTLGQSGNPSYSADPTRTGKGRLDGIFVANGCNMPCTDNFTNVTLNSNVFVDGDNITKPYQGPLAPFPLITSSWQVFGVPYTHLACPLGTDATSCPVPSTPPAAPSGTSEFFVSRAANMTAPPATNCTNTLPVGGPACGWAINALASAAGLTKNTLASSTVVRFYNQSNQYMKAVVCWERSTTSTGLSIPPNTLEFGQPIPDSTPTCPAAGPCVPASWYTGDGCDTPAPSSAPLLLYFPSSTPATTGFNIQRVNPATQLSYRGSAIVVTNGLVQIEETWQTCQGTAVGSACLNHHFTADSSLTVLTWGGNSGVCNGSAQCGNMNLGNITSGSQIDRIMGLFYAGCDPADTACSGNSATKGFLRSRKQTNTVGVASGYRLCFSGGTAPCSSGGNVPSFFQVIPDSNNLIATFAVPGIGGFNVVPVAPYWVECKRNADGTLVKGTNDLCKYTP